MRKLKMTIKLKGFIQIRGSLFDGSVNNDPLSTHDREHLIKVQDISSIDLERVIIYMSNNHAYDVYEPIDELVQKIKEAQ